MIDDKLWLIKADGSITEVSELTGFRLLAVEDGSPQPTTTYTNFQGSDGNLDMGTTFGTRTITARFLITGKDYQDYYLLQQDIWRLIYDRNAYYIVHSKMPGKRWLVHPKPADPSKINFKEATIDIEFEAFKGYAESVASTLDPFTFSEGKWQTGQGLLFDDFKYTFEENAFKVYNFGDFDIDPRENNLVITITAEGDNLRISNYTTGDNFIFYGTLNKEKNVLKLDGIYPMLDDMHCGKKTNNGLITLRKGWNDIRIFNVSKIDISFDFHALYH